MKIPDIAKLIYRKAVLQESDKALIMGDHQA